MSETAEQGKHTPGPWIAIAMNMRWHGTKPIFPNGLWHVFPAGDTERLPICTVDCGDDHDDATRRHAESDARLIAAAPELLEALKELSREEYRDDCDPVLDRARSKAGAAIAKAEGRR